MAETSIARYVREGEKFEIIVRPDPALEYKLGKRADLSKVLVSDDVYSNSGKGTKPPAEKLQKAFGTSDHAEVARIIMEKGELNLTTEQRRKMTEEKRRRIVTIISQTYVDPKTHLPHPPLRVEQAMKDARAQVEPQRGAEEQVPAVVDKIRGIIALKSENVRLEVVVPAQFASKSYAVLKSAGTLSGEEWRSDGSLKAILEIPAASRPGVIDRLGSATRGSASVEVAK